MSQDPPGGPTEPPPGTDPPDPPDQGPAAPEPWTPKSDPRVPVPRALAVLELRVEDDSINDLLSLLRDQPGNDRLIIERNYVENDSSFGSVSMVSVVVSSGGILSALASVLSSWVSRGRGRRVDVRSADRVVVVVEGMSEEGIISLLRAVTER